MPGLDPARAREHFAMARVAVLGTLTDEGRPHLVPVTFALLTPDTIVFAVDHKPKRTSALARNAHIAANPAVSLLADRYAEDWSALWWARADGNGEVLGADDDPGRADAAREALATRYAQYRERPPQGPVTVIGVERWSGWTASGR